MSCCPNKVSAYLNEAIDRSEEGIIVKHPNSTYAPNKRKGSGWFKIKPDYVGGVVDDLDLVIVGGKFGSGRHGSLLNKFMLAVRKGEGADAKFLSFSMVGSGYSNKELLEITETLKPHLSVFQKQSPPAWLVLGRDKPEVVVRPEKSVVVQVSTPTYLTVWAGQDRVAELFDSEFGTSFTTNNIWLCEKWVY